MARQRKSVWGGGITAAALYAGAAALVAVPSAGYALGAIDGQSLRSGIATFTPASVDARLASLIGERGLREGIRFTPAGAAIRSGRSVTVAVRVDNGVAEALSIRSAIAAGEQLEDSAVASIAPTRYNLGLARGYQSFARKTGVQRDLNDTAMPDLASFRPSEGVKEKPSRFNARIAVEEELASGTAKPTREIESVANQTFDLGGSYRVTRNLDVTAGVRYSQDSERLVPLTNGEQDSQAVYIGTQFRF
ncbi:MAG TPA: hypothetical protein VLA37_03460 [Sphingomonadaceae bacterium]|nr:hypothetical protein [Sphingomonadaceae bacterium]